MSVKQVVTFKCSKCGASAYPDLQLEGFNCRHCGNLIPWRVANVKRPKALDVEHWLGAGTNLEKGAKLTTSLEPHRNDLPDKARWRPVSLETLVATHDLRAHQEWKHREGLIFRCNNCGGDMRGFSTQTIFECDYCGNKIAEVDVIRSGKYQKNLIVGFDNVDMIPRAIPFRISEEEAKTAIVSLVQSYPQCFANDDIIRPLYNLMKIYVPVKLADAILFGKAQTERGNIHFYQRRQNWTLPETRFFDAYLLNCLHPWDFGSVSPFHPAFLEGNVRVFGLDSLMSDVEYMELCYRTMITDLGPQVQNSFGVNKVYIEWVNSMHERFVNSTILLPIYLLDRMPLTAASEKLGDVRFAVNGQTGKVASLHNTCQPNEYLLQKDPTFPDALSEESTHYSPLIPLVSQNRKDSVFIVADAETAFKGDGKKGGKGFFGLFK